MGGKSGPDTHVTTQETAPPSWLKPYLTHAMGEARGLYENQPLYSSTELPGEVQRGFQLGQQTAATPQLIDPAAGYAQQAIGGDFLTAPALRGAARAELDDVAQGVLGSFEGAGRTGSGLAANALGRGVTSALGNVYQRERGLQQQAAGMAPGLEQARYMPSQQMVGLGMQQRGLEDRYYREPWERLGQYTGLALGGAPAQYAGQTTTGTQPIYQPSPWQTFGGLGMMGLGLLG